MKILDCTYTHNLEGEPIIHLYGVGGKHITRSGHRPYFYAEFNNNINNEVAARLLHSRGIHDFVKVEKFRPIGYQSKPTTMYQIFTISPRDIRQLREEVSRIPNIFKIYEADIPYKNRWLIDNGLGGFADIDCGEDAPISYCSFDIECLVPPEGTMPTSDKDPVILISMAFSPQFEGNDRVVLSTKPTNYRGCPIIICKDEHSLITTFLSFINTYNPDIIAGYNTNQFDFPYLQGRCKVLGISPKCTRDNREWYIRNRFDGGVDVTITGRVVVDLLPIIRANYSLNRYNLATAASLVNYEKLDVSPKEMRNAYLATTANPGTR
jgi:DNA polymerase I